MANWRLFNWPFTFNLAIFLLGMLYAIYLDRNFLDKELEVPFNHKAIFLVFAAALVVLYLVQFYYITAQSVYGGLNGNKLIMFDWILQMFVGNLIAFALIYFALSIIYPGQFKDTQENIERKSLLNRYIEMIYFSSSTFFTIGFGDVVALKNTSRILNMIQIFTAYVVQTYLYADILLGSN